MNRNKITKKKENQKKPNKPTPKLAPNNKNNKN